MSDSLYDLLQPHLPPAPAEHKLPPLADAVTPKYLARLPKLDLNALQSSEPQSLAQSAHSNLLAIQALSSRSAKSLISSSDHLGKLSTSLPRVSTYTKSIHDGAARLDGQAVAFSDKYARSADTTNDLLERRKRVLLLARNTERVADMLELPTLLSSAVHSASTGIGASGVGTSGSALNTTNIYNAALDLHGHVKRLTALHPSSILVQDIGSEAAGAMREMTASLIQTLKGPTLKLAGGMRTIGWLRRVAPDLVSTSHTTRDAGHAGLVGASEEEGSLGALFLVCRLANLINTLDALEPLRELADQETRLRTGGKTEATGHQTERFLKRFIELFREQSFGIVSMFRSIFPSEAEEPEDSELGLDFNKMGLGNAKAIGEQNKAEPAPSALSTLPLHLISEILLPTLREYIPNIVDRSAKESLLTQALYCAGSFGRLGGDFSLLLADLYDDETDTDGEEDDTKIIEWVELMQKHRVQAARLESLSAGSSGFSSSKTRPREVTAP